MGYLLLKSERLEEAMAYYEEAQEGCRRVLGEEHPLTFNATGSIGGVLQAMGQLDEALIYRREALDGYRRILGDAHPSTLHSINLVGTLLLAMQRFEDAEQLFHEAAAGAENLPPEHVLRSQIAENLAELYDAWHAAEPNQGHDRSADHWRSLLEETQETAASVSQP
jgi:non-specific serine/threonine protein kinase/serine/threonine-protein kinase